MKSAYFFNLSYRFFFQNSFSKFSKKTCVTNGEFYFSRQIKNGSKDFAFFNFPDPSKNILPHLIAEVCKEMCFHVFQSGWISQCKTQEIYVKSRVGVHYSKKIMSFKVPICFGIFILRLKKGYRI